MVPRVVIDPKGARHTITSSTDLITLSCTAIGEGIVYWQRDGVNISDSDMPIADDGNTLVIEPDSITSRLAGTYQCIAGNIAGLYISEAAVIMVSGVYHCYCTVPGVVN